MMLYSSNQFCLISWGIQKDCINDGSSAAVMSQKSFVEWMFNNKINPDTRAPIQPETFYFYNCHIETNKYNNQNAYERFGNSFDVYEAQYEKAKSILGGLQEIDDNLPQEIKDILSEQENYITSRVKLLQSAEEIHKFLTKIAKRDDVPLGKAIKSFIDKKEYKDKYKEAKKGFLTLLKEFLIKCFLAIYESVKWCFTVDLIDKAKDNGRNNCEKIIGKAIVDFRTYITQKLDDKPEVVKLTTQ